MGDIINGLAGIGAIVQNGIYHDADQKWQERQATTAFERNMQLQQQNQAFQEQMMDKMNSYNSPLNQMAMLQAAGLNPQLLAGSPISESASPSGAAGGSAPMASGQITSTQVDPLTAAKIANLNSQTEETLSRIPINRVVVDEKMQSINESKSRMALFNERINTEKTQQDLNKLLGAESAGRYNKLCVETQQMIDSFADRMDNLRALTAKYNAEQGVSNQERQYIEKQVQTFMEDFRAGLEAKRNQAKAFLSQSQLSDKQKDAVQKNIDLMDADIKRVEAVTEGVKKSNKFVAVEKIASVVESGTRSALNVCKGVAMFLKPTPDIEVQNTYTSPESNDLDYLSTF